MEIAERPTDVLLDLTPLAAEKVKAEPAKGKKGKKGKKGAEKDANTKSASVG